MAEDKIPVGTFDRADAAIIDFGLAALTRAIILLEQLENLRQSLLRGQGLPQQASHLMTDICANTGMASTCLFDDTPRLNSREKPKAAQRRRARAGFLLELCQEARLDSLRDRAVRNRLMHADEHFARLAAVRPMLNSCVLGDRHMISAADPSSPLLYDRVLILSENTMLHLDQELRLSPLLSSCKHALDAIEGARGIWHNARPPA